MRIKACPFCGEYPELKLKSGYWWIICKNSECPSRLNASVNKKDIIDAWNTRLKPKKRESENEFI